VCVCIVNCSISVPWSTLWPICGADIYCSSVHTRGHFHVLCSRFASVTWLSVAV